MRSFFLKRLGLALITLFLVSILLFITAEVVPGDIGRKVLGPYATAEQVERLNEELGVNRPLWERYPDWAWGFAQGNWGESFQYRIPVRGFVLERLGNSLILAAYALLLVVPFSI